MTERLKRRIGEYIDRRMAVGERITTRFEGQGPIVSDRKKLGHESTAPRNDSKGSTAPRNDSNGRTAPRNDSRGGSTAPARMEGKGTLVMNHQMKFG
jgi:hypothetical protein